MAYKYFGPYEVLEHIGKVAYKLDLPPGSLVHPVFHVSQLKDYRSDFTPVFSDLKQLPQLDAVNIVPERILDRRMVKKGNSAITQVQIKWTNLPDDAATWEDWEVLADRDRKSVV